MKYIYTITVVIFLTSTLWAQSPDRISYQAVIRNSSDNLVSDTNIGMQISILQGSENGTVVYVERQFPSTNKNGLVTIEIGNGVLISGSFSDIDWADGPYFIKTETDLNGGANYTHTGISQFLSVPYALYAKVSGSSVNSYNDLSDTPTIPTATSELTNDTGFLTSYTETQILSISNDTIYLTGGSYVKLPITFSGDYNDLTNAPTLSISATSGSYNDLSDTPSIPTTTNELINNSGFITSSDDADANPTNELQSISISNDTVYLTDGGFFTLPTKTTSDNVSNILQINTVQYRGELLYIHPTDNSEGITWHNNGTNIETGATSTIDGKTNSELIVYTQGDGEYAAYLCDTLTSLGFDDWYLPSKEEMNAFVQNSYNIEIQIARGSMIPYWTSTEVSVDEVNVYKGYEYEPILQYDTWGKDDMLHVRCIRKLVENSTESGDNICVFQQLTVSEEGDTLYISDGNFVIIPGISQANLSSSFVVTPIAYFNPDQLTSIETGESVSFLDTSINNPTAWYWTFEGGTPSSSSEQNPTVIYNSQGLYDVSLIVSNSAGSDTLTIVDLIQVQQSVVTPIAYFNPAQLTSIETDGSVSFQDTSINNPTAWYWTFEGGTPSSSSEQNPTVIYNSQGLYDVNLIVSNSAGNDTLTIVDLIQVQQPVFTPVAEFYPWQSVSIGTGDTIAFKDTSYNNPTAWYWIFEGGYPATSTMQNPTVRYDTAGVYDVTLIASNSAGTDTLKKDTLIKVYDLAVPPIASYSASTPTAILINGSVSFLDNSQYNPTSWSWFFEGGTPLTSDMQNPTVTYQDTGVFDVTLIVKNANSSDTLIMSDYIEVFDNPRTIENNGTLYVYPLDLPMSDIVTWGNGTLWIGATSSTDGATNTNAIVTALGEGEYAAYICDTLNAFGYTDWYLPASDEMTALYQQRDVIGGFGTGYYWSSSELLSTDAWMIRFSSGTSYQMTKNYNGKVRCVRR